MISSYRHSCICFIFILYFSYRTTEEVQTFRKERDPIKMASGYITDKNLATEDELKSIQKEVKKEIKEAVDFCTSGSELPAEELYSDIYTNTPIHSVRGCDPFTWGNSQRAVQ